MRQRLISLISLSSFLTVQMLPCLAQSVPTHTWTPPTVPTYQHTWQSPSIYSANNPTPHHWNNTDSSNNWSNTTNNNGPNPTPHHWNNTNTSHTWTHTTSNNSESNTNSSHTQSANLDLSSTSQNVTAPHALQNETVTINVGGTPFTVNSSSLLTPAERLAVQQILTTGQQSLVLDAQGSADGGTLIITPHLSQNLSSLVIPKGVTVIDLSKSGTLNLSGNITDDGSLYVTSFNHTLNTVTIDANNINVQAQGLISDVIPSETLLFCCRGDAVHRPWVSNTNTTSNLNLSLNAVNNITNAGTISSGGSLNLTAGGSIINALPSGTAGAIPTIQAVNNVNLTAGSSNISNAGLISSTNSNINISSSVASNDININGAGGTFQALNGNINIRDTSYTGAANVNLSNGNFLSQQFNIYSGTGSVTADVGLLTGMLDIYADNAHVFADTPMLVIGNSSVTGDPLYAVLGSVTVDGVFNTIGANLAIIATGSISSGTGGNAVSINTANGNLWIIAGADITAVNPGGGTTGNISSGTSSITSVSFQFDSTAGGNIDFTPATASTVITTLGGSVTLLANSNSSSTGNIWFPTSTISIDTTHSSGIGGAVLVVAGGTGGTALSGSITSAIQLGQVQTAGSTTTATGTVQIAAATPTITNGGGIAIFTNPGNVATTSATFGYGTITSTGAITVGNIITAGYGGAGGNGAGAAAGAGASITISSGGSIQTGNLLSYGGGGGGGLFSGGNGGNAGTISVTSTNGSIDVVGEINASGGGGGGSDQLVSSSGGNQANITLSATNSSITVTGNILSYQGGFGNGGQGTCCSGGGGGSFGGGGGGGVSTGNGAGGGGGGAASGGGAAEGNNNNETGGTGGGFAGGGSGGTGNTSNGTAGSALSSLIYGTGQTGGTGGGGGAGGAPSGTGNNLIAGGGTGGGGNGQPAGIGHTTGGTLTVDYLSSYSLSSLVVANTIYNQTIPTPSANTSTTTVTITTTNNGLLTYLAYLDYLNTQQQLKQRQQAQVNEQIGTRIAIDYTPWTTSPWLLTQFNQFLLQGNVTVEQIAGTSEGLFTASGFNANELTALANQGIVFGSTSNGYFFDLVKGFVLFMPTNNITVQTREGLVFIPKGAIVWIMETGSDAAIYDLHDSLHTGVVKITANKKEMTLAPGTEILLTRNETASFDSLNPGNTIGYRNVKVSDIGDGIKAFVCDFSIEHGLAHIPVIHSLFKSKDPTQRKAAWKMIKDATIIADLTGGAGSYKTNDPNKTH